MSSANAVAPPGWARVTIAGKFSIALPPNLTARPQAGLQPLVRRVPPSTGIELRYDYGKFADRLWFTTKPQFRGVPSRLSGRPVRAWSRSPIAIQHPIARTSPPFTLLI